MSIPFRPILDSITDLKNLDFSRGFLNWFASSDKIGGSTFIPDPSGGVRIVCREGGWRLEYKPLLRVSEGECFTFEVESSCRLEKTRFCGRTGELDFLSTRVEVLDENRNPVRVVFEKWVFGDSGEPFIRTDLGLWRCGDIRLVGSKGLKRRVSFFQIPRGGKYLSIILEGRGEGECYIRCIELKRGIPAEVESTSQPISTVDAPRAAVYRRLPLGDYAAKLLRIGDLNGDGRIEFVFAQNEKIGPGDVYKHITCLTAVDLEGRILWQIGSPSIDNFEVTSDLPVSVYDIDGDGRCEVICCMDFKMMILDGSTGKVLRTADTPESHAGGGYVEGPETLFGRINGDCIVVCNLRGLDRDKDLLLKDRYNNVWAYNDKLEMLWHYSGKLIHSPLVYDIDGDKRMEVFVGDALLDHDGSPIWRIDIYDHCDSAVVYRYKDRLMLAVAYQNGGFHFLDAETGEMIKEYYLGHAQTLSLGYIGVGGERLICGHTFWGGLNQFIFNLDGDIIYAIFGGVYGWMPVSWVGDGSELLASPRGLYDCYGNMVIEFPDPHIGSIWGPKVFVCDICSDAREEVIVWDERYLTIYTQKDYAKPKYRFDRRIYNQTFYGNGNFVGCRVELS